MNPMYSGHNTFRRPTNLSLRQRSGVQIRRPLRWVSPFGDHRIKGCSRLPGAYRSVPRPSSPLNAKASVRSPYALDRSQQNSCARITAAPLKKRPAAPTHALWFVLPDYDVFSGSALEAPDDIRGRTDPSFTMSTHPVEAGREFVFTFLIANPGGARRDRTDDLMLAKHALYQLSYGPSRFDRPPGGGFPLAAASEDW